MTSTAIVAVRDHYFDAGHRVLGHEGKCAKPHGHGYRVELHCAADTLDRLGRVIDFGVIKERVCQWLDQNWDHRFLCDERDPLAAVLEEETPGSVFRLPYNPTAENMGRFMLDKANELLTGTGVACVKVVVHETVKCRAEVVAP